MVYSKVNQVYLYISPSFLDFLPIYITTELRVEFPVLHSRFSLVIHFIHSVAYIYMSISTSQFIPLPFPFGVHVSEPLRQEDAFRKLERRYAVTLNDSKKGLRFL